ncbi:class I SAM-dependent methyltransferase [Acidocella facilis]|uniref:class I SAM-dependent methyltransferase n=1 Tax=Acidocella facilis TaxID=525 RepID=UPI000478D712|nr:class I SAM-dependent methyltransferase [Acidocella facilis]
MAILKRGLRSGLLARAYRKLLHSIYVNDLWLDLRLHAKREAVEYVIAHMPEAMVLADRYELARFALGRAPKEGLVLEFGVAGGASLRNLAGQTPREVHGFDSFGGLPEDWAGTKEGAGAFTQKGKLPKVPANARLHPGWFDQTLPPFLAAHAGDVAFLHVDCDIYTSTVTIFSALAGRIVPGTVILFDEYFNYPGWRGHEYKAFQEFIAQSGLSYEYIGVSAEKGHVAVRLGAAGSLPEPRAGAALARP